MKSKELLEQIVDYVRQDFVQTIKKEEFKDFADMRYCYDYTADDIREEIYYTIRELVNNQHLGTVVYLYDDCSLCMCGTDAEIDVAYKDIKKAILANL